MTSVSQYTRAPVCCGHNRGGFPIARIIYFQGKRKSSMRKKDSKSINGNSSHSFQNEIHEITKLSKVNHDTTIKYSITIGYNIRFVNHKVSPFFAWKNKMKNLIFTILNLLNNNKQFAIKEIAKFRVNLKNTHCPRD